MRASTSHARISPLLRALALTALVAGTGCHPKPPPTRPDDPRARGLPARTLPVSNRYEDLRQHTFSETGTDADPELARDGRSLFFASSVHSRRYGVYEKELDGRTVSLFTEDPGDERFPRLSPDGKWVAFAANRNGNWDLYRKRAAGTGDWVVISDDPEDELWPTWSPDGRQIAYCVLLPDGWMIRTLDASGRKRDITAGILPAWHPKKPLLAFQRPRLRDEPWYAIWTIDLSTGRLEELVSGLDWAAINPAWSPDGAWLLFATVHRSAFSKEAHWDFQGDDLWIVPEGGGMPLAVTEDNEPKWSPMWGRDGRVYFVSPRSGRPNVWSLRPILPP